MTEEQKKLVEENHNLIYSFLKKYNLSVEDYYGLAAIGLCKASKSYNNSKAKFSTYAYKCMFTIVFSEIRDRKAKKRVPENQVLYYQTEMRNEDGDTTTFINYIPSKENIEENILLKIMFDEYLEKLDERDKKVLVLFRDGHNQAKIGEMVGCSQGHVSRIKKNLCSLLSEMVDV